MGRNVPADHWLRYVWNLMRSRCASAEEFAQNNKVSFVTFNYDRAVEWYFHTVLRAAFNIGAREARDSFTKSFPVVHLHGQIGADREFGHRGGEHLTGGEVGPIAAGIRVVHDPASERPFADAWNLFQGAQLVCILGFGYHPVNIERLRLKETVRGGVPIAASAYGMGEAEYRVAWERIQHSGFVLRGNFSALRDYKAERFLKEAARLV